MGKLSYYVYDEDKNTRYALGDKTKNPMICFGINPSKATNEELDDTLIYIRDNLMVRFGHDGFIMLNIYPVKCTKPDKLDFIFDAEAHKKNIEEISSLLNDYQGINVYAFWGDVFFKRAYFGKCLCDINKVITSNNCKWKNVSSLTDKKMPRHPIGIKQLNKEINETDRYKIDDYDVISIYGLE